MGDGAMTSQAIPMAVSCRNNSKPQGPASEQHRNSYVGHQPLESAADDLGHIGDVEDDRLSGLPREGGDDDPLAVDVEACVGGNLLHGWLLRLRLWPRWWLHNPRPIRALAR